MGDGSLLLYPNYLKTVDPELDHFGGLSDFLKYHLNGTDCVQLGVSRVVAPVHSSDMGF